MKREEKGGQMNGQYEKKNEKKDVLKREGKEDEERERERSDVVGKGTTVKVSKNKTRQRMKI